MVVFTKKLILWFVAIICLGSLISATREPSSLLMSRVGSISLLRIASINVEGFLIIAFPIRRWQHEQKGIHLLILCFGSAIITHV